jgi:hypothetical protein
MPLKFKIAYASISGNFSLSSKKYTICEDMFNNILKSKLKNITNNATEEYARLEKECKHAIFIQRKPVIIEDICFTIEGKDDESI